MFSALNIEDATNFSQEEYEAFEKAFPVDEYEEVDMYVWAQDEGDDPFRHPVYLISPTYISPAMDVEALHEALKWRVEQKGEAEGVALWCHLGRGWEKLGATSVDIDKYLKSAFIELGL